MSAPAALRCRFGLPATVHQEGAGGQGNLWTWGKAYWCGGRASGGQGHEKVAGVRYQVVRADRLRSEVGDGFCDLICQLDLANKALQAFAAGGPKHSANELCDVPGKRFVGVDWVQRVPGNQG